jgi:hypothetical protein
MTTWSRTLVAGGALILVTNAVALVGAAYNRAGDPESVLKLTQRELSLPYSWGFEGENSGITLRLRWRVLGAEPQGALGLERSYPGVGEAPDWLDKAKLVALGFDVSTPQDTPAGRRHYDKLLPKEVLLVLDLDGPAYRRMLERAKQYSEREEALHLANPGDKEFERRAKWAKEELDREERESSRLFVIDAGLDVGALRAQYPDRLRYAIVRGQVRLQLAEKEKHLVLSGYVNDLSIDHITVPLGFRQVFEPMLHNARRGQYDTVSRYEVSVAFGKRLEPWITTASATSE